MKHGKQVLRIEDVSRKSGCGRGLIYKQIAAGTFPRPLKIGPQAVGWLESEIDQWIEERVRERDTAEKVGVSR